MGRHLGIDCGSVSLNLVVLEPGQDEPVSVYRRTRGRPLHTFVEAVEELIARSGPDVPLESALATGSARYLFAEALDIPAVNEISAHSAGVHAVDPNVRTIIEIGGQDSKFMRIEPSESQGLPRIHAFRMNEVCAAGTGAFLDEQADRLGISVESFGELALRSTNPAAIAGRCAVFAKSDMIHLAQEGTPIPDILMGLAFSLARNYIATLVRGEPLVPLVALQGGVMHNTAVVHAFRKLLGLPEEQVTIPRYFDVLGAVGCAATAARRTPILGLSLGRLRDLADNAIHATPRRSSHEPLDHALWREAPRLDSGETIEAADGPLVLGLDVGSVSVKGVVIDAQGRVLRHEYLLSHSQPLETAEQVVAELCSGGVVPDLIAVTGSGRYLVGRLLDADLILNEITAQAAAALRFDPGADTIVEIGGQDSKWISLEDGRIRDFEMNRVCAAGTGSFLMAQAQRLGLDSEEAFSRAAFSAAAPADLGTRCTVFMESDLIHHQNNGASTGDLAAGVCMSIVKNYSERVANHKHLGSRVVFLGGVAASSSVRAAFETLTGRSFATPPFFKVSGAFGAGLRALELLEQAELSPRPRIQVSLDLTGIERRQFTCQGCPNQCRIHRYRYENRTIFNGGLCDRWETESETSPEPHIPAPRYLSERSPLLNELAEKRHGSGERWGMIRSPQFHEWFPFWKSFCEDLGIETVVAAPYSRKQFEAGSRFLRVETCLPMKALAGQIEDLMSRGLTTLFHPAVLSEPNPLRDRKVERYCPYIQAASQLFRDVFDVRWKEPVISFDFDPDALHGALVPFARERGLSRREAQEAINRALERLAQFRGRLHEKGTRFLETLGPDQTALVILGKPYHTAENFLNLNLASILHRIGIPFIASDMYPLGEPYEPVPFSWKFQARLMRVAAAIAADSRLFPVLLTFFGCSPDPFTVRHLQKEVGSKPLLILEMDEHSSRAGVVTRIEAFLDRIRRNRHHVTARRTWTGPDGPSAIPEEPVEREVNSRTGEETASAFHRNPAASRVLYLPYLADQTYGMAAGMRAVGIEAHVLPVPDEESERVARPYTVGGECHPYVLILGDYLKVARSMNPMDAERSRFYVICVDTCRVSQYPLYINSIRQELGLSMGVIQDLGEGLTEFGLSERGRQRLLLRMWEGLNAYDLLVRLYLAIRPTAQDPELIDRSYQQASDALFGALIEGRVREGTDDALHRLYEVPAKDPEPRPVVAITGDYYTRAVAFANNDVFREVEALGATIWPPPVFSDSFKMAVLRDTVWNLMSGGTRSAARHGLLYLFMAASEFRVKSSKTARRAAGTPLDISGLGMWRMAARNVHTRLSAGITAPLATALMQADQNVDGILNLMTLNCSLGTVVTAALARALKKRGGLPLLTLIFDGLKKTNERTRLEAFMEQVHDRFERKPARTGSIWHRSA